MTQNYVLRRKGVGEKIGPIADYSETGLKVIRSDHELPSDAEYCFRWGSTGTIPNSQNVKVVNTASAIHEVYDKRSFRKKMADRGIAPRTWVDFADFLDDYDNSEFKVIIRPKNHIRSLDMEVCSDLSSAYRAVQKFGEEYYISNYIKKDKEYRVFVIQGRVAAVVEKIPVDPQAVSWGCVDQGEFRYVPWTEWPLGLTERAVEAFLLSSLDFGALDIVSVSTGLQSPERAYLCLEINTAPELTPYYIKTFTKCFDYIVRNGKETLPIIETGDFKGFIHPAISDLARITE